jgi:hypothetical protein
MRRSLPGLEIPASKNNKIHHNAMSDNVSYWSRKKYALEELLAVAPPSKDKDTVSAWALKLFGDSAATPPTTGLKGVLREALDDLEKKRLEVTDKPLGKKRRSARLVNIVQMAIGAEPAGSGFYASVADATPASVSDFNDYRAALRTASEALAEFYDTCSNSGAPGTMGKALKAVLAGSTVKPGVKLEVEGLVKSLEKAEPKDGGGGEGASTWPSTQPPGSSSP